jgi:hypothetical protein
LISVVRRTLDQRYRFLSVPSVTWPLALMTIVVLVTMEARGGIGLRSMGSDVYGGRRYFFLLAGIMGYFALTAQPIPRDKARLYMGLFVLGGLTSLIGDVLYVDNPAVYWLFLFFPPNLYALETTSGMVRFAGIKECCAVIFYYLLMRYGIRSMFDMKRAWAVGILVLCGIGSLLGGFRSSLLTLAMLFSVQFFLEGLHRTKLLPLFAVGMLTTGLLALPFVEKMPYSVQRTLSILPIPLDPVARADAESTSAWRLEIWKAVLPQVPKYLLLGKGYSMTAQDYDYSVQTLVGTMKEAS